MSSAGVLSFGAGKDFESPDDADSDGVYEVAVMVSDGADSDTAAQRHLPGCCVLTSARAGYRMHRPDPA